MSKPLRFIVADDEPRICDFLRVVIEQAGHLVVDTVHDGRSLVRAFRTLQPDVIVTDVRMPHMDGIEAISECQSSRPIPVIIVSAYHDPDLIKTATFGNIVSYLVKPVKPEDLLLAVSLVERMNLPQTEAGSHMLKR